MNAAPEVEEEVRERPAKNAGEPVVEMADLRLSFGEKKILRGVSFAVQPRERLVILGASGSGKSTILRLLLGILQPDGGAVKIKGRKISTLSRAQLNQARQRIGMVYQYSALLSSLSVRDNLALAVEELTDKSREDIDKTIEEKLGLVEMADARDKMPAELSGGMKKRIAIARALMLDPEIILYDEPSAGLDPVITSVIDKLIISVSEKHEAASIIVTHEMGSAFKIATRMAMLHEGRIIADDTPERFRKSKNPVVAQFIHGDIEGPIKKQGS
jgi:phospholipid/cholesterol/gamma-HCH transport system ATP-binding protein